MTKFQVGDRVRVTDRNCAGYGHEGVIVRVLGLNSTYPYYVQLMSGPNRGLHYYYADQWFALVKTPKQIHAENMASIADDYLFITNLKPLT